MRARGLRLGLAARIALASVAVGLAVALAAIAFGYISLSRQLDTRVADDLRGRRHLVLHVLSEMPDRRAIEANEHRFGDLLIGHDDLHLAMADAASNRVIAAFSEVALQSVTALAAAPDEDPSVAWASEGHRYNSLRQVVEIADGTRLRFYLTQSHDRDDALLAAFLHHSLLGLPALLLLVGTGAWAIVKTGLAPLRGFNRVAASVGTRSLDQRISVQDLPAELAELGREFNRMLDRIDAGYRRLQSFAGDLAHELRTPMAILLGRSQVALSHERSAAELREVLEGNIEEFERLARLIDDMLFMAHAEHGESPLTLEEVSLGDEARRVADYLGLAAEDKGIPIEVQGEARVRADRLLVQRAITNLLTNALRHAAPRTPVRVTIARERDAVLLAVSNEGDPIAPDQQPRIFDRFYRVDTARGRVGGGTGLGLAIVRTVMEAHGGSVGVASAPGAPTVFTLRFSAA